MKRIKKTILIILGTLFVGIGVAGVFIPLLPTTPFLLLAAACYMRSSKRAHQWLLNNKWLGTYISNYVEKRGIQKNTKIISLSALWLTIGYSTIFVISAMMLKIIMVVVALAVTLHVASLRTLEK